MTLLNLIIIDFLNSIQQQGWLYVSILGQNVKFYSP
jgi:hypothetical protein